MPSTFKHVIQIQAIGVESLIGTIGGYMGLFCGNSAKVLYLHFSILIFIIWYPVIIVISHHKYNMFRVFRVRVDASPGTGEKLLCLG
jgi:hypothetical protein